MEKPHGKLLPSPGQPACGERQNAAKSLHRLLAEYREAPEVTRTRLYLEVVENLLNRLDSFTVVDPAVKGVLPVFTEPTGGKNQ